MSKRLTDQVTRGLPVSLSLNGRTITAYQGETLATVIMMSDDPVCRWDRQGLPRAPFCNMGVCFDCLVSLKSPDESEGSRMVRACMAPLREGLQVTTLNAPRETRS